MSPRWVWQNVQHVKFNGGGLTPKPKPSCERCGGAIPIWRAARARFCSERCQVRDWQERHA